MNKGIGEKKIILSVKNMVTRFGRQVVHDHVDLEVMEGEILGLVGGSGSGKSVLLKTMIGLRKPGKGDVLLAGKPVGSLTPSESAAMMGVMFQEDALFSSMNVLENILLPLREHTRLPEATLKKFARLKLALAGFPKESVLKFPSELSGGMRTRASLARALALDPRILFLDEPTSGLDPLLAASFDELIVNLNRNLGITVVMATHDLDTLFAICDRVAVLADKKITVDSLPHLLKNDHAWIKQFFHGPRAKGAAAAAELTHGN